MDNIEKYNLENEYYEDLKEDILYNIVGICEGCDSTQMINELGLCESCQEYHDSQLEE